MTKEELIERLADIEHLRWVRRTAYLFSKCQDNLDGSFTIPSDLVAQWNNHMMHSYADMADTAREQVRDEVAPFLPIIEEYGGDIAAHVVKEIMRTKNPGPNPEPALPPMPNPTLEQIVDPVFQAIWQTIKNWDVNVPEHYVGYCGATGSHAMLIFNALKSADVDSLRREKTLRTHLELIQYRLGGVKETVHVLEDQLSKLTLESTPGKDVNFWMQKLSRKE